MDPKLQDAYAALEAAHTAGNTQDATDLVAYIDVLKASAQKSPMAMPAIRTPEKRFEIGQQARTGEIPMFTEDSEDGGGSFGERGQVRRGEPSEEELRASTATTGMGAATGALLGFGGGALSDRNALTKLSVPEPPVMGVGPKPVLPAPPAKPTLIPGGSNAPIQKVGPDGNVNWVHSMSDKVPDVVAARAENMRKDNPTGGQALIDEATRQREKAQRITGNEFSLTPGLRQGQTGQLALPNELVNEKTASLANQRAQIDAQNEAANRQHASEVARYRSEADRINAEYNAKKAKYADDVNMRNQLEYERKKKLAEIKTRPFFKTGKFGGGALGAILGTVGAPLIQKGIDYLKPEEKAKGGKVSEKIGKSVVDFLVKPTTGFLENTPKKPNPLVGTRFETKDLGGIAPEVPIDLGKIRGSAMNITPWDATHRNKQILSVSGRPLTDEIISHGGTPYARDIEHMAKGVAGASNKVISGRIQKRADIASKEGEKAKGTGEVVMLPSSMGKWSEDFAIPTFQTYMDLFKQAEHSPETIAKQTEYLRQLTKDKKPLFSNLLSLDNPDVMKQFLTGEGLAGSPGDARKAFIRLQRLKDNQRALGVNAEDISAAHTIPEIASLPRGFAGNTVIQMKPGAKTQPSNNETYDTDFLGNYLGNLGSHTPVPVLLNKPYTSAFSEMRARYPDEPEGKIHQMALGALERRNAGVSEVVDDEMINRVGQFHEGVKQGKIDPTDIHGALEYLKTPGLYAEGGEVGHFAEGHGVPKLPGKAGSLLKLLGLSDEAVEAWQKANKVSQRQTRVPQVQQAAQALREGQISAKEYRDIVQQYMPIKPFTSVPNMPTPQEMAMALHSNKLEKGLIESNLSLPKGTRVGSRLDIPAYEDYDKWVASIHEGSKSGGNALGYAQTAHLTGDKGPIQFMSSPKAGLNIAVGTNPKTGESVNKSTIARIHGDWEGTPSEDVYKRSQDLLGHPEWAQVGMNPFRHSYFYDKSDMVPVVGAEEVLQVGPLVLAKKPKKVDPDDPQFRIDKDDPKSQSFKSGGGAWTRSEGKNPEGGLNAIGRASLKAQGHDIKPPQPEGGSRKDSFCARMGGMKKKLTSSETANDPDSRINKALRKWKC